MLASLISSQEHEKFTFRPYAGIVDRRFKLIECSLGHWMVRVSGIIEQDPLGDATRHANFIEYFRQYAMNVRMDKEQRANFTGTITELRKHVFEIMDVIVTTASNAGDAKLYEWVQPSMIFVDDAARVPEPDSWSLFAFYAVDTPTILVGDMAQLKPPAHYENRFRQQFSLSLMGRFAMIGYPLVMLNEQHRMHSSICKVVSTTFYDGKIRTAPGTDDNPLSQTFREYMQEHFKLPRDAALLNCVESMAECDDHSSVFNNTHVRLVGHLVRGLMERGVEPSSIAILTPYDAQFSQYRRALSGLQAMYPLADMREIALGKIDAYQGRQADIVIVDLPNHETMGFLEDPAG